MEIKRDYYLQQLINLQEAKLVKVITGLRRSGKSYLLNVLFYKHLRHSGVKPEQIIQLAFDRVENEKMRKPARFNKWITQQIKTSEPYYILLDEVQMMGNFTEVLNSLLHYPNVSIYVTGSNARFLSKDILTEFRGRGYEIHIQPLCFAEYYAAVGGDKYDALDEYMMYGGMPELLSFPTRNDKENYLKQLFELTYITDIQERYLIRNTDDFDELINVLASGIGCLTNATKIANTFNTSKHSDMQPKTVRRYIEILQDSFLIEQSMRYDIKGRAYINTPYKYYFQDLGLRNARLNFRQLERTHLLENLIYNELRRRGMSVDVGVVVANGKNEKGVSYRHQYEIDFVCNKGYDRYYIQSALAMPDYEKVQQEMRSLKLVQDAFSKYIIVGERVPQHTNTDGIQIISIYDFLLNDNI